MNITPLPTTWSPPPGVRLKIVAHITQALREISREGEFDLAADEDSFSAFHAAHLQVDDMFVVLIEYDPAPDYTYVLMSSDGQLSSRLFAELLELWNVDPGCVAWTTWTDGTDTERGP